MNAAPTLPVGLVLAGSASFILNGAGQSVLGPALPVYERLFGISPAGAGLLISIFWIGAFSGVATLIAVPGRLTARWALSALAAGSLLLGLEWVWATMLTGAFTFGYGYGAIAVIFNRRFLTEFGSRGPSMLGMLNAMFCIGAIVAPLVFVALGNHPQPLYLGLALLCAAAVPFASRGPKAASGPISGLLQGLRPGILIYGMMAIGVEAGLIGLGPAALVASGITEVKAAQLTSMFFIAYLAARIASVWIAPLLQPFSLMMGALGLTGLLLVAASVSHPGLFYVLSGACIALVFPAYFVCASARLGQDARVAPVVMGSGLVGGMTAPILIGMLAAGTGPGAFPILAAMALGITAVALLSWRGMTTRAA